MLTNSSSGSITSSSYSPSDESDETDDGSYTSDFNLNDDPDFSQYGDYIAVYKIEYHISNHRFIGFFLSKTQMQIESGSNKIIGEDIIYVNETDETDETKIFKATNDFKNIKYDENIGLYFITSRKVIYLVKLKSEDSEEKIEDSEEKIEDSEEKIEDSDSDDVNVSGSDDDVNVSDSKIHISTNFTEIFGFESIAIVQDFTRLSSISAEVSKNPEEQLLQAIMNTHANLQKIYKSFDQEEKYNNLFSKYFTQNKEGEIKKNLKEKYGKTAQNELKKIFHIFRHFTYNVIMTSVMFQINSLNVEQINTLFSGDNSFNFRAVNNDFFNTHITNIKPEFLKIIYHNGLKIETANEIKNLNQYIGSVETSKILKESIENDNENYKHLNVSESQEDTYIHIYTIGNIIDACIHNKNLWFTTTRAYDIASNILTIINNILQAYDKQFSLESPDKSVNKSYKPKDLLNAFTINENEVFKMKLSNMMKENAADKIITYVRINNFDHSENGYNKRFDISIAKDKNAMIVGYNDDNEPYYIEKAGKFTFNNAIYTNERDIEYKKEYYFGNYSNIFGPKLNNNDIASQMKFVIDKVKDGKPVFILGYGASGSGKTSALIYFNKGDNNTKKNGVVLHICNELAKIGYTEINMKVEEYFIVNRENYKISLSNDNSNDNNYNTVENPIKKTTENYKFIYDKENFYLKVDKQDQDKQDQDKQDQDKQDQDKQDQKIYHSYRYKQPDKPLSFNETSTMGQIMMELIDKNRFVKATTNNPQSSRSHSMAYLELIHNDDTANQKKGYIIVGDYAGIENEFTCNNSSTIIDFLEIKRDCIEEERPCQEYYKDEVFNNGINKYIDPYDKISEIKYIDDFKIPFKQHITDFVNRVEEGNLKTIYAILKSNFEKIKPDGTEVDQQITRNVIEHIFYTKVKSDFDGSHQKIKDMAKKINEDLKEIRNYSTNQKYSPVNKNIENINNNDIKNDVIKSFTEEIKTLEKYKALIKKLKDGPFIIKYNDPNKELKDGPFIINDNDPNKELKDGPFIINDNDPKKELTITYDLDKDNPFNTNFYLDVLENIQKKGIKQMFSDIVEKSVFLNQIYPLNRPLAENCQQNFDIKDFFKNILNKNKQTNIFVNDKGCIKNRIGDKDMDEDYLNAWYNGLIKHKFFQTKKQNLMINSDKNFIKIYNRGKTPINVNYEHLKYWHNNKNAAKNINNDLVKTTHFFNEYPFQTTDKINEVEKKIEIVESLVEIFTKLSDIINIGKQICNNRLEEGKFINESLRDMRETIKDIVTVKTKDKIFNSPDYVDFCLSQYCPTHTDCFKYKSNTATDTSKIKSLLIRSIYDYIKKTKINTKQYTIEEFYKEILISVFCVFNISRSANNPPSIPYIDINELKINVMLYKKNGDDASKDKMLKELVLLYCKLGIVELNESDNIVQDTISFAKEFIDHSVFKDDIASFNDNQQTEKKSSPEYITTFKNNQINTIITSAEYKNIYKFLKEYNNNDITETIETIEEFIQIVDGNNAVSAIGTLEFTDQIAKYNTTQTICNTKGLENPNEIGDYKSIRGFVDLYHPNRINNSLQSY